MPTVESLTDDKIREIEVEAEREGDVDAVRVCQLAYRRDGRGNANPAARLRVVKWLNQRSVWAPDKEPV